MNFTSQDRIFEASGIELIDATVEILDININSIRLYRVSLC